MGRKKVVIQKIENHTCRQVTYTKRKDSMIKKANELSVLCDAHVALIMFSPSGHLTAFGSNGRVDDLLLHFVDKHYELRGGPLNNKEILSEKLKQIKREREMLEKISVIQELEEKLNKLNSRLGEAQEKMRCYEPNVEKIKSVIEANEYQHLLSTHIQRIHLSKARLLSSQIVPGSVDNVEGSGNNSVDQGCSSTTNHSKSSNSNFSQWNN